MNREELKKAIEYIDNKSLNTLFGKNDQYATDESALHNFERGC